jgi:hypothetical protein
LIVRQTRKFSAQGFLAGVSHAKILEPVMAIPALEFFPSSQLPLPLHPTLLAFPILKRLGISGSTVF